MTSQSCYTFVFVTKEEFDQITASIPSSPGIYKYFDKKDTIIYVGKAKDLKKRITSYFSKQTHYQKTIKLVSEIARIEFALTPTEHDAFLLENTLIKSFQPKYNIELKDDKTYPYIVIKKEPFPRVFLTRRYIRDGSEYLGPYTSVDQVRSLLEFIRETIPLRTCSLPLSEKNINAQKFKPCLEYHIGKCKAPCAGYQKPEDYNAWIAQLREILKGKFGEVLKHFRNEMQFYAEKMEFEKAEWVRKKIEYIQNYQSKSIVVNTKIDNVDVCSILSDEEDAYINYMIVVQGAIVQTHTAHVKKKLKEEDAEILPIVLQSLRERFSSQSNEIVAPFEFYIDNSISVMVPKSGDKKKLLDLSLHNATFYVKDQRRKKSLHLQEMSEERAELLLKELQKELNLQTLPLHIECFDNSNFQGSFPVAAMVCFKNALPYKKEYRHFHIKTVKGINDFASMKEIVYRRYKRLTDDAAPLPDLIVIDGGKGQLSSAVEALDDLSLLGKVTIIGLAKNVEEVFFPGDKESILLPYQSDSLNLLKRIRDEVHRFGITFHRKTRSEGTIKNELQDIPGIGEKTATQLLNVFRSVSKLKKANFSELKQVAGEAKARLIADYFGIHTQ